MREAGRGEMGRGGVGEGEVGRRWGVLGEVGGGVKVGIGGVGRKEGGEVGRGKTVNLAPS